MNTITRTLTTFGIVLTGALLASALMLKLSPNSSWLAFVGWVIFFAALQLPWLLVTPSAQSSCTAWLARFRKGV
ncbi:MAG: hypothetical protein ACR2HX_06435 [Pyrinomonadaceae bacterium]